MTGLLLFTLLLLGTAVVLVLRGFATQEGRSALAQIDAYGFRARVPEPETRTTLVGLLGSAAGHVGNAVVGRIPRLQETDLRRLLVSAGMYSTEPRRLLGAMVLSACAAPLVWLGLNNSLGYSTPVAFLGCIVAVALGFYLPMLYVKRRARNRLDQIEYELPELVDLLVVTIEAGVGFLAALQMASNRLRGPIADELKLTLQEQRLGLATADALRNLMERVETPSVRSFVRSILQGEQLGVSTGHVMRNLALEMRKRRKAAAEERAHKAPIKILFPLVFLIFPSMFIVLMGPALKSIFEAF